MYPSRSVTNSLNFCWTTAGVIGFCCIQVSICADKSSAKNLPALISLISAICAGVKDSRNDLLAFLTVSSAVDIWVWICAFCVHLADREPRRDRATPGVTCAKKLNSNRRRSCTTCTRRWCARSVGALPSGCCKNTCASVASAADCDEYREAAGAFAAINQDAVNALVGGSVAVRERGSMGIHIHRDTGRLVHAGRVAMHLVAAIVLAGIILYYLRTAVVALNSAERYYTACALVLASAVMCLSILERY